MPMVKGIKTGSLVEDFDVKMHEGKCDQEIQIPRVTAVRLVAFSMCTILLWQQGLNHDYITWHL